MRTMRDKLIRLQKLYIEQFGRLGHLLRESRRTYLAQVKEEREAGLMNMSQQPGDPQTFSKLKALTHYHCPAGREALLAARQRDKRAAVSGGPGGSKQSSGASSLSVGASPAPSCRTPARCSSGSAGLSLTRRTGPARFQSRQSSATLTVSFMSNSSPPSPGLTRPHR